MKSKKELKDLAYRIAQLELQLNNAEDKNVQEYLKEIEEIMESLSLSQGLELNDMVLNILHKIC